MNIWIFYEYFHLSKYEYFMNIWIFYEYFWTFPKISDEYFMNIFGESEIWIQEGWTTWRFQIWVENNCPMSRGRKLINFGQLVHFHLSSHMITHSIGEIIPTRSQLINWSQNAADWDFAAVSCCTEPPKHWIAMRESKFSAIRRVLLPAPRDP